MINIYIFLLKNIVLLVTFIILLYQVKERKLFNLVKIVSVFLLFFLFSNQLKIKKSEYQNKLAPAKAGEVITNVLLTFYDGSSADNDQWAGQVYYNINNYKLADGMVAADPAVLAGGTIIYVKGPTSGEGSYANGKYFIVADIGGGIKGKHIDVAVLDKNNATAHINLLNAPYGGTGHGDITVIKTNATWEDYVKNYRDKNGFSGVSTDTGNGHTYQYGECTVNDGDYDGDVKNGYIYKRFENTLFKNLHSSKDIEKKAVSIIQDIFDDTIQMYGNPSYCGNSSGEGESSSNDSCGVNTSMWWPVGSKETTKEDGVTYASGDPETTGISSPFTASRTIQGTTRAHRGIDISNGGHGPGEVNVIAALDGTVVYPESDAQTKFSNNGYYGNPDGGGFGNYIVIEHSNGVYTYYGHLSTNSIKVRKGDKVKQGQLIAKMGNSGSSTGTHLHFEIRVGSQDSSNAVDPLTYVDPKNPRPKASASSSNWSLTTTSLTKKEFRAKLNSYCKSSGNQDFCNYFAKNANTIYDSSKKNNVNPELVVVTAGTENSWKNSCGNYNFWGIGMPNGSDCSSGPSYSSMSEAVAGYAKTIQEYLKGGSKAQAIEERYNERSSANCDCAGYGHAGTLEGMQSVYSWIGDYRYNPGDSSLGGCYYLNGNMYDKNYCSNHPTCTNYSSCPANSKTTVCEQNDYTAWQLKGKKKIRFDIFGL